MIEDKKSAEEEIGSQDTRNKHLPNRERLFSHFSPKHAQYPATPSKVLPPKQTNLAPHHCIQALASSESPPDQALLRHLDSLLQFPIAEWLEKYVKASFIGRNEDKASLAETFAATL